MPSLTPLLPLRQLDVSSKGQLSAPVRSSCDGCINSVWSDDLDAIDLTSPQDPFNGTDEDTVWSSPSSLTKGMPTEAPPDELQKPAKDHLESVEDANLAESYDTAETLRVTIESFPTPPRPTRILRPPQKLPLCGEPAPLIAEWSLLSSYCSELFAEYDDLRESLDVPHGCVRADSLDLDPVLLRTYVQEACQTRPTSDHRLEKPLPSTPLDVSQRPLLHRAAVAQPPRPLRHPMRPPDYPRKLSQSTAEANSADIGVIAESGELGSGPCPRSPAVKQNRLGLALKRVIGQSSYRNEAATTVLSAKDHYEITPFPFESPKEEETPLPDHSGSRFAEAGIQLKLPDYHRSLRKQTYPPRVRYAVQEVRHVGPDRHAPAPVLSAFAGSPRFAFYQLRPALSS
ncbi:hypothetical protein PSEUBRA_000461 [Kalmanozyma brasiliensis GHG001]|uniref:uncharacterized protein n=1 Tax=Kalmanozyma brasiliensis (strain GHG001) TaxID=1365824 RepID=UPI002867B771|nr:uncharacterized protein PSEUBRA_000461 [Kalmanozyma brasiliensis GHG001]KAF6766813.1 hypothetical protein PSEUBRA_000461 [Kalmanozyma brasiliensis GHG001]